MVLGRVDRRMAHVLFVLSHSTAAEVCPHLSDEHTKDVLLLCAAVRNVAKTQI